jgi:hypothetical protein
MADIKWSAFPSGGTASVATTLVGLQAAVNVKVSLSATPSASGVALWDANSNFSARNVLAGYTTTATAAATTTLTVASTYQQYFTGATTQIVVMPVASTLVLGQSWLMVNRSSGAVTVNSSGGNAIQILAANTQMIVTCILASGTDENSWAVLYRPNSIVTPLSLANGGTSASLVASNGGIFYSTATAGAILSGTATANQILLSGSTAAPTWSTATFPSVATGTGTILRADGTNWVASTNTFPNASAVSTILYASATNVISALATANNGLLVTSNTGVPSVLAGPGTTGNILQSNAAAAPSFSTATYPAVATGTGTILRADGTNWVASTNTFPNTAAISTILYASAANVISALATANNAVLTTGSGGVPVLTVTPKFSVGITANQTIGDNTQTKVQFNSVQFDTNSNFDATTNYRFTPTIAGYYSISATIGFLMHATDGVSAVQVSIYKNGAIVKASLSNQTISALSVVVSQSVNSLISMNGSTDYIEIYAYQTATTTPGSRAIYNQVTYRITFAQGTLVV